MSVKKLSPSGCTKAGSASAGDPGRRAATAAAKRANSGRYLTASSTASTAAADAPTVSFFSAATRCFISLRAGGGRSFLAAWNSTSSRPSCCPATQHTAAVAKM